MTLADIIIPLCGSISNERAQKIREACDMQERRVEALEKRVEALSLDVAILVEGTVEAVHEAGLRTLAQRVEALEQIRISHEADYSKSASVLADRIEALDRALSAAAEDNGDLDVRVPALERASAKNTGEGHGVAGSTPAGPSRSTTMPSTASPASEVKACPFCGGRARLISHESPEVTNYGYEVNCDECAAQGPSTDCEWDGNAEYAKRDAIAAWNRRAPLAAEKAEEPDAPGIAEAPDGTLPCVYCSNENLCVEIRDDKHPGMLGFSVRCGSAFCGARGPVRPAQMDAVEEWNRAYRWVHPPKAEEPAPSPQAQGEVCECGHPWSEHVDGDDAERHARRYGWTCVEDGCECAAIPSKPLPAPAESAPAQDGEPTLEDCQRAAIEATRKLHPNASDLALLLSPDEAAQVAAVRALCLASRARDASWRIEVRGSQPQCWVVVDPSGDCGEQSFTVGPCFDEDEREDAEHFARMTRVALERMSIRLPSPALAAIVEAGDAMQNAGHLLRTSCYQVQVTPEARMWDDALAAYDRARAALPKGGAA